MHGYQLQCDRVTALSIGSNYAVHVVHVVGGGGSGSGIACRIPVESMNTIALSCKQYWQIVNLVVIIGSRAHQ